MGPASPSPRMNSRFNLSGNLSEFAGPRRTRKTKTSPNVASPKEFPNLDNADTPDLPARPTTQRTLSFKKVVEMNRKPATPKPELKRAHSTPPKRVSKKSPVSPATSPRTTAGPLSPKLSGPSYASAAATAIKQTRAVVAAP